LADDHAIVRQGIKRMIEEMRGLTVIGEANDGIELLNLVKDLKADMVILDISMPNLRGIETTRELKKTFPDLKVLILTMHKDREILNQAILMGADGYILKEDTDKVLSSAIEKIRKGEVYISPRLSEEVKKNWVEKSREIPKPTLESLTKREMEILRHIAKGKSSKEIAKALFISIRTVENHKAHIMSKVGINKIGGLITYAIQKGYLMFDNNQKEAKVNNNNHSL
jgi:DNA-binding NarL/FixJ family response regulator